MGIGFVILIWLIVGGVLLAVYRGLSGLARRSPRAALLKRVLVALVAAVAIPVSALMAFNFAQGYFPASVFEASFGFRPPPDVKVLEGRRSVFGDSGAAYLRFRASRQTVERIVNPRFSEISRAEFVAAINAPETEEVRTQAGASTRYFRASHDDDSFASSQAYLSYEETTGQVYFQWSGVD